MDTAESRRLDAYEGGSTNPGPHYTGQPNVRPADGTQGTPPPHGPTRPTRPTKISVGTRVTHAKSGQSGQVVDMHVHGHTGERYPVVRWDDQQTTGLVAGQGYSLDSLTTP